ncbi:MAG TPA: hypothetical protein VFR28_11700 [Allosphingosinicella sp.]|jgi:hypothetical protein|nr:hypothetical protein [Allosphingosinicella sp.]
MSLPSSPKRRTALALAGLVVSACTPQARDDASPQVDATTRAAEKGVPATAPPQAAETLGTSPAPEEKTEVIGESEMAGRNAGGIYVARLKKALAIPLLAPTGTVHVKNGCLVATIDGIDHTAVLPPQARLIGPANAPTAVKLSRRSVPIGESISLPAGGAEFSASDLQSPIPDNCPARSVVFAG